VTEKAKPAKVDYEFRERLAKVIDGNRVATCYQCGACVGDCPSVRYDESFNPREIMLKALYGLEDELLGDDTPIWNCSNCYTCTERCPQDVKPVEVIIALKNMLRQAGRAPEGVVELLDTITTTGRSTMVTSATLRRRDALDLPPLLDPPVDEIHLLVGKAEGPAEKREPLPVHPQKEGVLSYAFFPGCLIPTRYPQMEASIRRTLPNLGIEIVDLPGFSCCPDPIFSKATDKLTWLTMAARNLAVAEEVGLEIFTICSGCTATLSEALHMLREEPDLKDAVNKELAKVGRKFTGEGNIRHIVTILRDEVGIDKVAASVTSPLDGRRVAVHYGCHLLKPSKIMCVDEPDDPTVLDDLMTAIGVTPVRHRERVLCCGKACRDSDEIPDQMVGDILDSALEVEAEILGVICPSCFDVFDVGQLKLSKKMKREKKLPAAYFFQLLALAQGLSPKDVGLDKHKVKATSLLARAES
jgi:heterodisulfide reductase subunit B2